MRSRQLKRILDLIRKTGDRMVVADSETDKVFVIMDLDEYENLSGFEFLGDDADLDDSFSNGENEVSEDVTDFFLGAEEPAKEEPVVEAPEKKDIEEINRDIAEWREEEKEKNIDSEKSGFAGISSSASSLADILADEKYRKREFNADERTPLVEEDLSDVPAEEEKFYLEPVE